MFSHSPLKRQNGELRLVRSNLTREERMDLRRRVSLELCHASMNDEISYAALSYVWGNVSDTIEVEINGGLLPIGLNLHTGLQQLRRNEIKSWLWIDSICIHQDNPEEKSWQVSRMADIYSHADLVYVWLGPGTEDSNMAMDFVSSVGPRAFAAGALDLRPY